MGINYEKLNPSGRDATDTQRVQVNLRQSTILWLLQAMTGIILGSNFFYYWLVGAEGFIGIPFIFYPILALYLIVSTYLYPSLAKFENTIKETLRFAVIMSIRNLGYSLIMLLIGAIVILVSIAAYGLPLVIAPGLIAFGQAHLFQIIFDKFIANRKDKKIAD